MKPYRDIQLNRYDPLSRGLVGCWLLNEGSGKIVKDYSGDNSSGSLSGDAAFTAGKFGTCINFDGNGDYINLGNRETLQVTVPFSVSAWIRMNSMTADGWVIATDKYALGDTNGKYYGCHLKIGSSGVVVGMYGDGTGNLPSSRRTAQTTTAPVTANTWHHIVLVCRGPTDWTIAVNGINLNLYYGGSGGSIAYSTSPAVIGQNQSVASPQWFNGKIDNCLIYNRPLQTTEISRLYYKPFCMFEDAGSPAKRLLAVNNVSLSGFSIAESSAAGRAEITVYIPPRNLPWRQDAVFNAMTVRAVRLGSALYQGWFWARPHGCQTLHRGTTMDDIDYSCPLAVADNDAGQIRQYPWVICPANSMYYYNVLRYNRYGACTNSETAAVKVSYDSNCRIMSPVPNMVYEFTVRQIADDTNEFLWFYNPLGQQSEPVGFNLYWDNGSGLIDYDTPVVVMKYQGRGFYNYIQSDIAPGRYRYVIFAVDSAGISSLPNRLEIQIKEKIIQQAQIIDAEGL
jgi:hypothetical protein